MADPLITPNKCPQCGAQYPADILICPECRDILEQPPAEMKTPRWLILLLLAIIALLASYAGLLVYQVFVRRQY